VALCIAEIYFCLTSKSLIRFIANASAMTRVKVIPLGI
jgi:hypothetical protein